MTLHSNTLASNEDFELDSKQCQPISELVYRKVSQDVTTECDDTVISANPSNHHWEINWTVLVLFMLSHAGAVIGIYMGVMNAQISTLVFYFILIQFGATGIICGAHRLWTHRTYKANIVLRTFLMLCQTLALQVV